MSTTLPIILALNNIRSLHNTGAIFRTADALNLEQLILGGLTPVPPRPEIDKTALGACQTVAFRHAPRLESSLTTLKSEGYTLYAVELTPTATPLYSLQICFPAVFVLGHERMGVEPSIIELCQHTVALPMRGQSAYSLNVSNAAAVVGYEALRQWQAQ
ncbi:MAG: TrmH family RNA methyltransferase [Methanothrix sp.]